MHGRPLQELVDGEMENWPSEVFVQISESHVGRAIRTRKWKYSVRAPHKNGVSDSDSDLYVEDFLYDLEADPHERSNLVNSTNHISERQKLAKTLQKRMKEAGEKIPRIVPTD